jgi:hypothetical protein
MAKLIEPRENFFGIVPLTKREVRRMEDEKFLNFNSENTTKISYPPSFSPLFFFFG